MWVLGRCSRQREQCVQGPKMVHKPGCKWRGGDGRRLLLQVQVRTAGRLE